MSGLLRESPVGGYFDDSEPGLAATVASVRPCVLATRPGTVTRYSNLAPSIAGMLVERASGLSFEDYFRERASCNRWGWSIRPGLARGFRPAASSSRICA